MYILQILAIHFLCLQTNHPHNEAALLSLANTYASTDALMIAICVLGILILGSEVPAFTQGFQAVIIQSVCVQLVLIALSLYHKFPCFVFHPE